MKIDLSVETICKFFNYESVAFYNTFAPPKPRNVVNSKRFVRSEQIFVVSVFQIGKSNFCKKTKTSSKNSLFGNPIPIGKP